MGANSILIEQARGFSLLVGNYSRKGFSHPGPAFLYVESWGESVFWAWLRLVPAAWNGQLIALYALNAVFTACVVAVAYGWTRSPRGALAAGAAVACLGAAHPAAFSSDWMPWVYVLPFLTFTVSLASVAAGQRRDAWVAALSGWFLIHGHAAFLFVVPAMAGVPAALAAARWLARRRAGEPGPGPGWRSGWVAAGVISALFALPMVLELAVHGDANFARYFAYGSSSSAGGHTAAQVTGFVLWFWWPGASPWLAPLLLTAAAAGLTALLPAGQARAFCRSLLLTDALAVTLVTGYAVAGVDQIGDRYIGYFSYATPAVLVLVVLTAAAELLAGLWRAGLWRAGRGRAGLWRAGLWRAGRARAGLVVAAVAAVAACAAFAAAPDTRTSTVYADPQKPHGGYDTDPHLPAAVARMGALAAGRMIVLSFPHDGWTDVTGILVQASRTGVPACVADPGWAFLMSSRSICSPAQARGGYPMTVYPDDLIPRGADPVARLQRAIVTSGTK